MNSKDTKFRSKCMERTYRFFEGLQDKEEYLRRRIKMNINSHIPNICLILYQFSLVEHSCIAINLKSRKWPSKTSKSKEILKQ